MLDAKEQTKTRVSVYLNNKQTELIEKACRNVGLKFSSYLRSSAIQRAKAELKNEANQ